LNVSLHRSSSDPDRQPAPLSVAAGALVEAAERESRRADWSLDARAHFADATKHLLAAAVSLQRAEKGVSALGDQQQRSGKARK